MSNGTIPEKTKGFKRKFNGFSTWVAEAEGRPYAFLIALLVVIIGALTAPIFNFSENCQLTFNTVTSITTFLIIFVIQQSQNKDTLALHSKLNELMADNTFTSNRLINFSGTRRINF